MKVYNLEEVTSSNVMYKRNPPRFIYYIITIVLAIIIAFIVWSCNSIKTFIVKGQGVITREDKSNVMVKVSGEIKEVHIKEGQTVKAGEVLLVFSSNDPNLQMQQIKPQLEYLNQRISLLKRAEKEASQGINTFNKYSDEEKDFYNKLESLYVKGKDYEINEESLKGQGYTDEQISEYKKQTTNKLEGLKYETILSFTNERTSLETEKVRLESQVSALNKSLEEYKLFAPIDGVVHLNVPLNSGMVLQGGTLLGTISNSYSDIVVDAMIPSIDRPRIHVGDDVSLAIGGLNQVEYGTLNGNVLSIDNDATIDNEKGNVYFRVKIKPDKSYLEDKKGEIVNLTEGMVSETRVRYDKITYMQYFMELIGIKFN